MKRILVVIAAVILTACTTVAEVKDSATNGFTIATTFTVKGTPGDVYRKIVNVAEWWKSEHTYSGNAHNLTLDARAGGCWCEKLTGNGSVAHMQVATAFPGTMLVLTVVLGPLQPMGSSGAMTFNLSSAAEGTKVDFTYTVTGYSPRGMSTLAPVVDGVLMNAMARLQSYINTGVANDAKQ